jgi:DNA-binding transcriptional MerR regulator/uncharacterized protein YdhG (YjbR/CyaY superfamily)
MAYSIKEMSDLSGLTPRTLRYYDQIGLLKPAGLRESGYRYYDIDEVDRLQQILFYRELGFPLEEIKRLLESPGYDKEKALVSHLEAMKLKRRKMDTLIGNLQKTLRVLKGEVTMSDQEKFEGFKQQMIQRNEDEYGREVREKYGDDVVEAANRKIKSMTKQQMDEAARLSEEVNKAIGEALATKDPTGAAAMKACALHKKWLEVYWPDDYYRPEAHKGLADMYCQDQRFRAYYEKIGPDCADFLKKAIDHYCDTGLYSTKDTNPNDDRKNPEVDVYISQFPPEVRGILEKMREMILGLAPGAKERIAYGMPTYTMKTNLIHFAGYKKHIGLYPTPDGIEAFKEELAPYKNSKGAIQFPIDRQMPWDLIEKIVKYRVENFQ